MPLKLAGPALICAWGSARHSRASFRQIGLRLRELGPFSIGMAAQHSELLVVGLGPWSRRQTDPRPVAILGTLRFIGFRLLRVHVAGVDWPDRSQPRSLQQLELSSIRSRGQWHVCRGAGVIVGVEFRCHQTECCETPRNIAHIAHLARSEHAAEQLLLAV